MRVAELVAEVFHEIHVSVSVVCGLVDVLTSDLLLRRLAVFLTTEIQSAVVDIATITATAFFVQPLQRQLPQQLQKQLRWLTAALAESYTRHEY